LLGAPTANGSRGAASIFTLAGSTWGKQAEVESVAERRVRFGFSVALSSAGDVALMAETPFEAPRGAAPHIPPSDRWRAPLPGRVRVRQGRRVLMRRRPNKPVQRAETVRTIARGG